MPHRAAADVGFGDLVHRDRGNHPRVDAQFLQRGLHRQRVHHGGQHPHIIGGGAFHPLSRSLQPAEDITAPDDHADFDAKIVNRFDLVRDALHGWRVQPEPLIAHQCFA